MKLSQEQHDALRARYNPDGSPTRNLQMTIMGILKEFDRICTENDIKYWLDGGTCLGAVRHGGFIPWDDDADVCMFRKDYERFLEVFHEDDTYAMTTRENDLYYTQGFAKMRLKGQVLCEKGTKADIHYKHRGPFLDIFIVEDVTKLSAKIFKQAACHMHIFTKIETPGPVSIGILKFLKNTHLAAIKLWSPLMRRLPWAKCRYALGTTLYKTVFRKGIFDEVVRIPFEGEMLPVPKDYNQYLTDCFGDYMSLPSEQSKQNSIHFN